MTDSSSQLPVDRSVCDPDHSVAHVFGTFQRREGVQPMYVFLHSFPDTIWCSNSGASTLQARFASRSKILYTDILPILTVVVTGVVAVVKRGFSVQTNRFR